MNKIYWMYLIRIELNLVSEKKIMNNDVMLIVLFLRRVARQERGAR